MVHADTNSYKYDAFISYSHSDLQWVSNVLLPKLESHSFRVLIDYRDFVAGSNIVEEMQRGVLESKRTIAVLTPNYVKSDWAKLETTMAQVLDPGTTLRKLIPLLQEKCDVPLRLRVLHYRDLTTDDKQQWELLIRDLL
jgi:hypothetical protein